jgi:hypothetical protein
MLSKAKHLAFSVGYEVEILRAEFILSKVEGTQNDILTQSLCQRGNFRSRTLTLSGKEGRGDFLTE